MMIRRWSLLFLFLLLAGALASCGGVAPTSAPAPSGAAIEIPPVEPGKSVITGRVYSLTRNEPLGFTIVRLAEVFRTTSDGQVLEDDGAFVLDGARSPAAATNEQGYFVFANVEPREYVLVIGEAEGVNAAVTEQSGKAKVWMATAGQVLDIGEVRVNFP
jgi:hypothetical protein